MEFGLNLAKTARGALTGSCRARHGIVCMSGPVPATLLRYSLPLCCLAAAAPAKRLGSKVLAVGSYHVGQLAHK